MRFADDTYDDRFMPTIGVDFKLKTIALDSKKIKLQVWDTGGSERFRTITPSYFKGTHGLLVIYDIADRVSFHSVQRWMA